MSTKINPFMSRFTYLTSLGIISKRPMRKVTFFLMKRAKRYGRSNETNKAILFTRKSGN